MSKVIPLVSLLKEAAATEHECTGSSFSAELAKQTQHGFRGIEACHSPVVSTFLYIRFKNLAFRDKDNVENTKKRLITEMQENYQQTSELSSAVPQAAASSPGPSSASPGSHAPTSSSAQVKKRNMGCF